MKPRVGTAGDFKKVSSGTHLGICYRLVDCGTQPIKRQMETVYKPQIQIGWEIHGEGQVTESGEPLVIFNKYVDSPHEASNISKMIKAWLGIVIDENFLYDSLLGRPAFLGIVHTESKGTVYANVNGVMSPPPGYPIPRQHNPSLIVSLAPEEFHQDAFDSLSEKMRKYIAASPEYMELVSKGLATPVDGVVANVAPAPAKPQAVHGAVIQPSELRRHDSFENQGGPGAPPRGHPANETDDDPNALAAYKQYARV